MKKKIFAGALLLCLCLCAGLLWQSRAPQRAEMAPAATATAGPKVMVLNYHKIEDKLNALCVPPQDFEMQLQFLKENGYNTITPHELVMALTEGAELPANPVIITFDDGYSDNYHRAFPLLKKYGMKATIFTVTSFMDKNIYGYLSWAQAKEMQDSGLVNIESHTHNHHALTDLTAEQCRAELAQSKKEIEEKLGKPCEFVAYPTGTYDLQIAELVKEEGYLGGFSIRFSNVDMDSNVYALERMPIFHTENTMRSFYDRMQYVPYFDHYGWEKN